MLFTIVGGLVVGAIACAVKPGRDNAGWIVTIIVGVFGSLLGSGFAHLTGLSFGVLTPIFFAIALLYLYDRFFVNN